MLSIVLEVWRNFFGSLVVGSILIVRFVREGLMEKVVFELVLKN